MAAAAASPSVEASELASLAAAQCTSSSSSCRPLAQAAPKALLKNHEGETSTYRGQKSESTFHLFSNETDDKVEVYWFHDGGEVRHGAIAPHSNVYVGTYTFHQWKVVALDGRLLGVYSGDSATITVHASGCRIQVNGLPPGALHAAEGGDVIHTPDGDYRVRSSVIGMKIWAFDFVGDAAIERLAHIAQRMLERTPAEVLQRMADAGSAFAVAGKDQAVTDLPPHQFMKHLQVGWLLFSRPWTLIACFLWLWMLLRSVLVSLSAHSCAAAWACARAHASMPARSTVCEDSRLHTSVVAAGPRPEQGLPRPGRHADYSGDQRWRGKPHHGG
mmetsp:Transcript_39427/g.117264  ORF Transcript_39427/g.117264 Transcript_39427/m.117264 type:complete len:331 (-) Transcript_39427:412-1404(-)